MLVHVLYDWKYGIYCQYVEKYSSWNKGGLLHIGFNTKLQWEAIGWSRDEFLSYWLFSTSINDVIGKAVPPAKIYLAVYFVAQVKHPSALENFDRVLESAKGKPVVVFLDYDGTLSPIVEDPECAFMSDEVCCSILLVDAFLIILTPSQVFFFHWQLPVLFWMEVQMRLAVKEIASLFPTAIITGRSREKVIFVKELFFLWEFVHFFFWWEKVFFFPIP